jgi:hypothetical protein
VRGVQTILAPLIQGWAGNRLLSITPSGSFAKGTAIRSGTDLDLFISLPEGTTETLKELYEKLFSWMGTKGYTPKRQNVSVSVRVSGAYGAPVGEQQRCARS